MSIWYFSFYVKNCITQIETACLNIDSMKFYPGYWSTKHFNHLLTDWNVIYLEKLGKPLSKMEQIHNTVPGQITLPNYSLCFSNQMH